MPRFLETKTRNSFLINLLINNQKKKFPFAVVCPRTHYLANYFAIYFESDSNYDGTTDSFQTRRSEILSQLFSSHFPGRFAHSLACKSLADENAT